MLNTYSEARTVSRITQSMGYEMTAMHLHDDYEIYMSLSPNVRFFVNDRVYLLEQGDVMLFSNNDLHKVSVPPDRPYRRCVITFPHEVFRQRIGDGAHLLTCFDNTSCRRLRLSAGEQAYFLELAERIRQESENPEFSQAGQWLYLGELLLLLCRISRKSQPVSFPDQRGSLTCSDNVIRYIDEHYMENITLEALSARCFLNKSYLCRLFKRETGFHIHDYLTYRRISRAMELLQAGESVSRAAQRTGFSSDTFFIRVFRQHLNMTPYQYALKHRQENQPDA